MSTYTADQLASFLDDRGAEVSLVPSPEGAVHEVTATYRDTTVRALFVSRTGRFSHGTLTAPNGQSDVELVTLKSLVDALNLPAAEEAA